jgi:hypothetical protein
MAVSAPLVFLGWICDDGRYAVFVAASGAAWFGLVALGMWRIRPIPGDEKWFRGWFAPLLPIAAVFALLSFRLAGARVTGQESWLQDPSARALRGAAVAGYVLAWIPVLCLIRFGRRHGLLLFSLIVMPIVLGLVAAILGGSF